LQLAKAVKEKKGIKVKDTNFLNGQPELEPHARLRADKEAPDAWLDKVKSCSYAPSAVYSQQNGSRDIF